MNQEVENLTIAELQDALRNWARGLYGAEAAVELLIGHGTWLRRADFRKAIRLNREGGTTYAYIDSSRVRQMLSADQLAGSSSELGMLALACGLLDTSTPDQIGSMISNLDSVNLGLLMQAMARARGWHEHGHSTWIGGVFHARDLTFEMCRARAYGLLGDAGDEVRGDWPQSLSSEQRDALREFHRHLERAKEALNKAVG